jgi:hypothetical protein
MPVIKLTDIPDAPGAIKPTMFEGMDAGQLTAGAIALQSIGQSTSQIAKAAADFTESYNEAKDTADLAKADTIMRVAWEKQQNEQIDLSPDEWGKAWTRNLDEAKRQLGQIKFNDSASRRLGPSFEKWSQVSGLQIQGEARKKQIDTMEGDVSANFLTRISHEDIEGGLALLDEAVRTKAIRPERAKTLRAQAEDNIYRKAKAERNANIESDILLDPQKYEEDFMQGIASGSSKLRPDLTKEEMLRFLGTARQQSRVAEVDKLSRIEDAMLKGEFRSVEELEKALDRPDLMPNVKLPERAVQSLKASFLESPERQAAAVKLIPAIVQKIEAYDPSSDSKLESYFDLASEVRSLPEGYRREPLDLLYDKFRQFKEGRKPAPATALGQIKKQATDDLQKGGFGKWKTGKDGAIPEDQLSLRETANLRFSQEMTALDNWAKANPDKAKIDTEVYRAHNEIITELNKVDAAAGRPSTRRPVEIPSISKPPANPSGIPDPDEILRTMPTGASAPGARPVGKVTSYNFPNDPLSDSNSRNLIGAWNNRLTDTSLAISPDIERKFKAAGIKEGDAVELILADGSRVVRNWDDRTMQDAQAIKKFGKPLRGRFDFHSPQGRQANDGIAVVSFRKAAAA